MPKPLFLHRPAGLYVRFRVPADLLGMVGSRFLVRPLKMVKGDRARLVAECMAVALSEAFGRLRQGIVVGLKKALEAAQNVGRRDLTLGEVSLPNGVTFRNVQIDTPEDERQFRELVRDANKPASHLPAPVVPSQKTKPKKEDLLSHQIAVHLGDLERASREKKTILDSRHALRLFAGIVGDKHVAELSGDDCRSFFDEVAFWPRNASKQSGNAGLSVREIISKAKTAGGEPPAAHTLSKHRQRLSVFLNFLLGNDRLQKNPFKGIAKASKFDAENDTGRAFTEPELDAIFEPVAFVEWSAKYSNRLWAPLIGLFTGARITEVCRLYVDDICTEHGVPGFHIRKGTPGQKLKNKSSLRFVPIAQPLLDAGFLSFVEDMKAGGHDRLFPHLPNADGNGFGRQMRRQFSTYIKARGVGDAGMGFHAFRHTLATRLDRARIGHGTIARITEHGIGGRAAEVLHRRAQPAGACRSTGEIRCRRADSCLQVWTVRKLPPAGLKSKGGRSMIRTNYVLVDYENVQPKSPMALAGDQPFKVLLFVGASQPKVTFEVAESMQTLGSNTSYIKISGNGSNALDFHVA